MSLTGIYQQDFLIALDLPEPDLARLCQTNLQLSKICQDQEFWRQRLMKYYPQTPLRPNMDYHRVYKRLYNHLLLVREHDTYFIIKNLSEIDLHGVIVGRPETLTHLPAHIYIRVYYLRYDQDLHQVMPILELFNDPRVGMEYHWNVELWQELYPLVFPVDPEVLYVEKFYNGILHGRLYRNPIPSLIDSLREEARDPKIFRMDVYLIFGNHTIHYTYDFTNKDFKTYSAWDQYLH